MTKKQAFIARIKEEYVKKKYKKECMDRLRKDILEQMQSVLNLMATTAIADEKKQEQINRRAESLKIVADIFKILYEEE